jgi:hypothetical protein
LQFLLIGPVETIRWRIRAGRNEERASELRKNGRDTGNFPRIQGWQWTGQVSLITTESKQLSERFRFLQFLHRYSDSEAASELVKYEDTQHGLSLKYEADVKRLSPSRWENVCLPGGLGFTAMP